MDMGVCFLAGFSDVLCGSFILQQIQAFEICHPDPECNEGEGPAVAFGVASEIGGRFSVHIKGREKFVLMMSGLKPGPISEPRATSTAGPSPSLHSGSG